MGEDHGFPRAFAVWHPDDDIRMKSSSGGAFTLLAEAVLRKGGVVFGAAWDEKLHVRIIATETKDGLSKFRGSKYVFSDASRSYREAIEYLQQGRLVLYSAAPCQVAGLYALLKGRQFPNLITVDFICHGMPDRRVFDAYVKHLGCLYNDEVVGVDFRDKRFGVESNLLLKVTLRRRGEKLIFGRANTYYHGFIHNVFMRPCCSVCKFNVLPRRADLSLCDYRGLGEHVVFGWERDKTKGFTGVLVNSSQGLSFLRSCPSETIKERPLDELTRSQALLRGPGRAAACHESFMRALEHCTWAELENAYLRPSARYRIYILARRILGAAVFLRLGILYKRWRGIRTSSWFLPRREG